MVMAVTDRTETPERNSVAFECKKIQSDLLRIGMGKRTDDLEGNYHDEHDDA